MSAHVSYWTGIWDPSREALSKEVAALRAALSPGALVVSFSAGQRTALRVRQRAILLSGRRWITLRMLAAGLERRSQVTHVFGEMNAWQLIRSVGRRPIVFTVALPGAPLPTQLLDKVSMFVAESVPLQRQLMDAGIAPDRIRLVYPGVDLDRFRPAASRAERFTILFASSPATVDHFDSRGIPLLVEAARRCPTMEIRLLWRTWGDTQAIARALAALNPPPNVVSEWRDVTDMEAIYRSVHGIAFLNASEYGKSCPNSVVEALACGCPAIVSPSCGIAELVEARGAGIVAERSAESVARAFETMKAEIEARSRAARQLAEDHFDIRSFVAAYQEVYGLLSRGDAAMAPLSTAPGPAPGAA